MESEFYYIFPAIRGYLAKREYYIAMCPLKLIPKIFLFNEEELPPEFRAQRILNRSRIPDIVDYILNNPEDYFFSSITASIDGEVDFKPTSSEDSNIGKLKVSMDASFLINDGQHRSAAIEEAIKVNPQLGTETISVVFFCDRGLHKSQQIFADLNRHAVNITKSIGILYDSRDEMALTTKELIRNNELLNLFTDKENSSLSKYSPKIFTLSNIYSTNCRAINKGKGKSITSQEEEFLNEFWNILCASISEWRQVLNKTLSATDLRANYIHSYGVVLEAIGLIAHYLRTNDYEGWREYITTLDELNWSRENRTDWLGRAIGKNGQITKSNVNILLTSARIKQKLGLPLSREENVREQRLKTANL